MQKLENQNRVGTGASEESLPESLVPEAVDVSTFPWAPVRLKFFVDTTLSVHPDAEPFRALVLLMVKAWEQVPAMTLPDDDRLLASWAGFGRDIEAWAAVREDVMAGWVHCSDGRMHHPEFSRWALQSWEFKQKDARFRDTQSLRARSGRQAKAKNASEQPDGSHGPAAAQPYREEHYSDSTSHGEPKNEERETATPSASHDQSLSLGDVDSISRCADSPIKEEFQGVAEVDPITVVFDHWRRKTDRLDATLTPARKKLIEDRLSEGLTPTQLRLAIDGAAASDWHQGRHATQKKKLDTLDVVLGNGDRVLRLASEADAKRRPAGLKPAVQRTADSLRALMFRNAPLVVEVQRPLLPPSDRSPL